jgi:hypothetical protein
MDLTVYIGSLSFIMALVFIYTGFVKLTQENTSPPIRHRSTHS